MNHPTTRRAFLQSTALAGAGFWVAGAPADEKSNSANGQIRFACIGVGGKGRSDSADAARHGTVVALCDVDEQNLDKAAALYPKAREFVDFRKLFDEMGKSIDAVTVSTPDHTHAAAADVPKSLHWDLWLGAAPARPYGYIYHPFAWRGYWDFGTGALGDMACHTMNLAFMALDLRDPVAVGAENSGHNKDSYPKWSIIRYAFPARGRRPALTLTWYDGGKRPPADLLDGEAPAKSGSLLIGARGKLYSAGD